MAINQQKFLPISKSSSAIVKFAGSKISTKKNKGGALVKSKKLDIKKFISAEKEESKKEEPYGAIIKSLVSIDSILKSDLIKDKKTSETEKQEKKEEKTKEREEKLEKKEKPKGINLPSISLPKFDFLESVKRYFLFTFLGWLFTNTQQYLPQLLKIVDIIKPVIKVAEFIFKGLLEGLVTFIDLGYKAYDKVRGVVKDLGGEGAQKTFDDLSKNLNTLITTTILVAGAIATLGDKNKKPSGTPSPKGGAPRSGVPRSFGGKPVPTTSGGRPLGRLDIRNPLRQKPRISASGGRTAGSLDVRNPLRQRPKITGTSSGRFSAKGAGKFISKGAPIIGPLIDFGIRTLIFKESPGRAAAGSIGLGVGQALGGWIGGAIGGIVGSVVPIAGNLLVGGAGVFIGQLIGGFIGDWIGTSLYDAVSEKKNRKVQKKEKGGSVYNQKSSQQKPRRSIKVSPRKPIKLPPQITQPGKDVGGEKEIKKLYPDLDKKMTLNEFLKSPLGGGSYNYIQYEMDWEKKSRKASPYKALTSTAKILKEIPFVGGLMGASVDIALGQKPDKNVYKSLSSGIGYLVENMTNQNMSSLITNIKGFADGGYVTPSRELKSIDDAVNPGDIVAKLLGPTIDQRVNEAIQSVNKELQKRSIGDGEEGLDSPRPEGGLESEGDAGDFSGNTKAMKAFNYFKSQGYTDFQASAIVGNLLQENRAMDPTLANSIGRKGIAQWDGNRWSNLENFARKKGLNPNHFETQLQFIQEELRTGSGGLSAKSFKSTKNLEQATVMFRRQYERPGEAEANDEARIRYARSVLSSSTASLSSGGIPRSKLDFRRLGLTVGERAGYSQRRGRVHTGRDIPIAQGTPLRTLTDAEIVKVDYDKGGYGYYVIYRDKNGREILYGHLREPSNRKEGDKLLANTIVGYVGSTGRSDGPHLHWEVSNRPGEVGFRRRNVTDPLDLGYKPEDPFGGEMNPKPRTTSARQQESRIGSNIYTTGDIVPENLGKVLKSIKTDAGIITIIKVNGKIVKLLDRRKLTSQGEQALRLTNNRKIIDALTPPSPPSRPGQNPLSSVIQGIQGLFQPPRENKTSSKQDGGLVSPSRPNVPNVGRSAYYDQQSSTIVFVPIETQVMVPVPVKSGGSPLMFPSASLNIKDNYATHSLSRG